MVFVPRKGWWKDITMIYEKDRVKQIMLIPMKKTATTEEAFHLLWEKHLESHDQCCQTEARYPDGATS
jgi:hypothetical protein